jgi:hypothetical protein
LSDSPNDVLVDHIIGVLLDDDAPPLIVPTMFATPTPEFILDTEDLEDTQDTGELESNPGVYNSNDPLQGFDFSLNLPGQPTEFQLDMLNATLWFTRGVTPSDLAEIASGTIKIPEELTLTTRREGQTRAQRIVLETDGLGLIVDVACEGGRAVCTMEVIVDFTKITIEEEVSPDVWE